MGRLSSNSGSLNLLQPYGPVQACNRTALPLPLPLPLHHLFLLDKQFQKVTYTKITEIVNKMEFKIFKNALDFFLRTFLFENRE